MSPCLGQIYTSPEGFVENGPGQSEVRSGTLVMISPVSNQPDHRVQVRLYRTTWDHFAVLFPDKKACLAIGCINLRNCTVERVESKGVGRAFRVVQQSCDAISVTFRVTRADELDAWVTAFQRCCEMSSNSKVSTTTSRRSNKTSLPVVVEEGDEE